MVSCVCLTHPPQQEEKLNVKSKEMDCDNMLNDVRRERVIHSPLGEASSLLQRSTYFGGTKLHLSFSCGVSA